MQHNSTKLPAAQESEQQIVGSILLEPPLLAEFSKVARASDLVDPCHRAAIGEVMQMHRAGVPIDVVTVKQRLEGKPLFQGATTPAAYLAATGEAVVTVAHFGHHLNQVVEAAKKRQIHRAAIDIAEAALNGQASGTLLSDLGATLFDLQRDTTGNEIPRYCFNDLAAKFPTLNPPIVEGLFRQGETVNVIANPKVGKSWLVYHLALAIITGQKWLGFSTHSGRVLLIDNELHPCTIAHRIPKVANEMGLFPADWQHGLDVWPLRGNLRSIQDLTADLTADLTDQAGEYAAIVLDAKYRFGNGDSENDNASETQFYNHVDRLAAATGAAIVLIHHSSKGSQSDKRVTDVGAGAGAQSRAADCHLVLREHEEPGTYVLDAAVRSFAPVAPVAIRWEFPLWHVTDANTSQLKGRKTKQEQVQSEKDREAVNKIVKALGDGPATARALREQTGLSRERQQRLLDWLASEKQVTVMETKIKGNPCRQYTLKRDVGD